MHGKIDKSTARIRRMFDEVAPTYDLLNRLLSLGRDGTWRKRAAETALPGGGGVALDVCTGTADLALALAERGARVVAVDFARRMLRHAVRKRIPDSVSVSTADTLHLPFPDDSFDACTVGFGLRNTEDPDRALSEMARVVRPEGAVVVLEFMQPPDPFTRFYVGRLLPLVGDFISRSRHRAYTYLTHSIDDWHPPEELESRMERAGLKDVRSLRLFPGIAAVHAGTKPQSN